MVLILLLLLLLLLQLLLLLPITIIPTAAVAAATTVHDNNNNNDKLKITMHIYDFALELSQVRVQQLQGKGRLPGTRSLYRHVSGVSGSDSTGEGLQLLRGSSDSRRQPKQPKQGGRNLSLIHI